MERENFGGRAAVIMTLAGSAIGLGNIWRFPYIVGENGGAAFILVYIFCCLFLSVPIFLAESVIGRRSGANCRGAMEKLAPGSAWKWLGYLSVFTPMLILSYYSVIGGWSLDYLWKGLTFSFVRNGTDAVGELFGGFISSTWMPLLFHTLFLLATLLVIIGGVRSGIEKFSKLCIPLLFVLIVAITIYSISLPGAKAGIEYLVRPDFSKLTARSCINALGQSFYSLSLGMGIIITYSSYVSKKENLFAAGLGTAVSDLLFAILAGFAIMPAVFAAGIAPGAGPGLIFETLPFIFAKMGVTMPWISSIVAILFFLTILFAALTSSVSLMEVGVAYLVEEKKMKRPVAALTVFAATWAVGAVCSLSFGPLSSVKIFGNDIFSAVDLFCSNVLLTVGGFLCVVFVGWKMKKEDVRDEFTNGGTKRLNGKWFPFVYFLTRYAAPVAVLALLITNLV